MLALSLLATACGGDTGETSGNPDGEDAEAAATDAGTGADIEPVNYTFIMGSSGSSRAILEESMRRVDDKYGHSGEWVEVAESEVAVEGVASGEHSFGSGVSSTVMSAVSQQDAPLVFIMEETSIRWTLASKSDIEGCGDLPGQRLGLHSPGGVSTALYEAWFGENCDPEDAPEIVYVAGSPNRYQGLLADQLDVTMLELEDTIRLPEDEFHLMANFAESLSHIKTGPIYSNQDFLNENPEFVTQYLTEVLLLVHEIYEDESVFVELMREHTPEIDNPEAVAEAYVENGILARDGGLTVEGVAASIELFVEAGAIEPGLKAEEITDTSFLEEALSSIEG